MKKNEVSAILNFLSAILGYINSILFFRKGENSQGIIWLLLSLSCACLGVSYLKIPENENIE